MPDFRLEVFYAVAKQLSFTKAAQVLSITQPAVTKHINELELQYNNKLFDRKSNKIELTPAGQLLVKHAETVFAIYRNIEFDMNALMHTAPAVLHLGTTPALSDQVLIPLLAIFRQKFPLVQLQCRSGSSNQMEHALLDKNITLALSAVKPEQQEIEYTPFLTDELVLACKVSHPLTHVSEINARCLQEYSFVMPADSIGLRELTEHALQLMGVNRKDLQVELEFANTESIKSYLLHSNCLAFLPRRDVLKELQNGSLAVIPLAGVAITRTLYFLMLRGYTDPISLAFMEQTMLLHPHQL